MKCCKSCDKHNDELLIKSDVFPRSTSVCSPCFPFLLDNALPAGDLMNSSRLRDIMMAACFLKGERNLHLLKAWVFLTKLKMLFVCFLPRPDFGPQDVKEAAR